MPVPAEPTPPHVSGLNADGHHSDAGSPTDESPITDREDAARRLAQALADLDLASDDTALHPRPGAGANDDALRREVPPHHN